MARPLNGLSVCLKNDLKTCGKMLVYSLFDEIRLDVSHGSCLTKTRFA